MGGLIPEGLGDGELVALQLFLLVESQPNLCFTFFQMIGILTVMMMMNQVCLQVVIVSPLLSLFLKEFLLTLLLCFWKFQVLDAKNIESLPTANAK